MYFPYRYTSGRVPKAESKNFYALFLHIYGKGIYNYSVKTLQTLKYNGFTCFSTIRKTEV